MVGNGRPGQGTKILAAEFKKEVERFLAHP